MVGEQTPLDYITMGGMFTILKVRHDMQNYDDPGWYKHPSSTLSEPAQAEDLRRDSINPDKPPGAELSIGGEY